MKQLLKASLIVAGLVGVAWGGPVGPPGGPPIFNSGFPQRAQFNVSSGTIRDALYIRYLVPGLCHSTDAQGRLISITCGSGGGQTTIGVNWNGVPVTSPTIALNALSPIIVTAVGGGTTAQFSLDPSSVTLAGQAIIRLQDTLQSGATLYISSGTILNLIAQNLVANTASFPNGLTANGTIIGNAQLQMFGLSTFFGPVLSANYGYQMPDGSVMTSTANFAWNSAAPQNATVNITSATIRTQLSLPFLTPSQCLTTDAAGHVISQVCGTGGTSIAISTGGVIITSPTVQVDFNGSQFTGALTGPTSSQISLNLSSVTVQGNSIRLTTLQTNLASVGVATGTLSGSTTTLQNQVTANTVGLVAVGVTTASLQTQVNGKGPGTITGVIAGANLTGGGTASNVTVALSTGITVASATVTTDAVVYGTATVYQLDIGRNAGDLYGSEIDAAEGLLPPGIVGAQVVAASSITHHLYVNPNNQGWHEIVDSSVTSPTTNGLAVWKDFGVLGDMGPPPWAVVPSTFPWILRYPVTLSSNVVITGASTTITAPISIVGYSTETISNEYFDMSQSSTAVGFIKTSNGYGTSGQVLTSGGLTSSATWTTISASGGSPLAVTIGVNRSSPTTDVMFNPNQATGIISGSSITVDISGLRTVGLDTATLKTGLVAVGVDTASLKTGLVAVGVDTASLKTITVNIGVTTNTISNNYPVSLSTGVIGSLPAASIAAGTLGASVIASSLAATSGSLSQGSNVTITGTWPNMTIAASASGGSGAIAVGTGTASGYTGVITSSPTSVIVFDSSTFNTKATGGATTYVSLYGNVTLFTATGTLANSDSIAVASCTTRGASPNAWITLTLPTPAKIGETHTIYNIGADSCSIRVQGNGTDLIESSGTVPLDAQTQHASVQVLGSGLWGSGPGGIQYTPAFIANTPLDHNAVSIAVSSQVMSCPIYIPVPVGVMGFRFARGANNGFASAALTDRYGKYITGVSTVTTVNLPTNYMTGAVTQVSPGWYRLEFTAAAVNMTFGGSSSVNVGKMFCSNVGNVGTGGNGIDLSKFTPTLPGTGNNDSYIAVELIFNGGMQTY